MRHMRPMYTSHTCECIWVCLLVLVVVVMQGHSMPPFPHLIQIWEENRIRTALDTAESQDENTACFILFPGPGHAVQSLQLKVKQCKLFYCSQPYLSCTASAQYMPTRTHNTSIKTFVVSSFGCNQFQSHQLLQLNCFHWKKSKVRDYCSLRFWVI